MKTYTKQDWFDVVARTALHGLEDQRKDKTLFHKWLAVWGMGLTGEIKEAIDAFNIFGGFSQEFHDECGDIFWYVAANSMLLDSPDLTWMVASSAGDQTIDVKLHAALYVSIERLELVKKIVRDDRFITNQIEDDLFDSLWRIYAYLVECCDFDRAIAAVEAKLLKRYPDGYSPERSIDRDV